MKPINVKELKELIRDIPDEVEVFVDFYNYKPVTDIGVLKTNGIITKVLIDVRKIK
jgi:hypothetical protein